MNRVKPIISSFIQYLTAFICFSISYMFTYPQYDVLLFTRDFDGDIFSVLHEALYYGNGRFLGNVFGFYFSHHFKAAVFVTAFFLTVTVILLNNIFFSKRTHMIFPIAVLIAFPAIGIIREVYSMIAAFCNYAIPFTFALLSILIIKKMNSGSSKALTIPLILSSAFSCLFSENTTVVMACIALIILICDYFKDKSFSFSGIINFCGTVIGTTVMFLIPRVTHTTENLSYYRGYVTEPTALIHNAVSTLKNFALLADQYLIIYLVISIIMIFVIKNYCRVNVAIKSTLIIILVALPISSIYTLIFLESAEHLSIIFFFLEILYLAAVLLICILSSRKDLIVSVVVCIVMLASAVAPIMIVNHRGDRTFFTTFAILLCYTMYLIASVGKEFEKTKIIEVFSRVFSPVAFISISLIILTLTAQNFAAYSFRANFIAKEMAVTRNISVPYLPHERLATENTFRQIDPCLFGGNDAPTYTVIEVEQWSEKDQYKIIVESSPIEAVKYAVQSWDFKDPKYPNKLLQKYEASN